MHSLKTPHPENHPDVFFIHQIAYYEQRIVEEKNPEALKFLKDQLFFLTRRKLFQNEN